MTSIVERTQPSRTAVAAAISDKPSRAPVGGSESRPLGLWNWLRVSLVGTGVGGMLLCATPGPHVRFSLAAAAGLLLMTGWLGFILLGSGGSRQTAVGMPSRAYLPGIAFALLLVHGLTSFVGCGEAKTGVILVLGAVFMFMASALPMLSFAGQDREYSAICSIGLGLSVYAVVNIFAYKFLGLSGLTMGSIDSVMVEVYGQASDRMIAPFADGLNNFGNLAACGSALTGLAALRGFKNNDWLGCALCGLASVVGAYAVLLVQMRSAVIVVGMVALFLASGGRAWGGAFLMSVFVAFAVGPWFYVAAFEANVPGTLVGAYPMFLMRSGEDPFLLSGRVYVWDYAFQTLQTGSAWLWGVGLAYRDMSPALKGIGMTVGDSSLTCHNGALDLFVSYGGVVGGAAVGCCGYVVARLAKVVRSMNAYSDTVWLASGATVVLMSASFVESLSNSGFFWGIMTIAASVSTSKVLRASSRTGGRGPRGDRTTEYSPSREESARAFAEDGSRQPDFHQTTSNDNPR